MDKCNRCGYSLSKEHLYCTECGLKREARKDTNSNKVITGVSKIITVIKKITLSMLIFLAILSLIFEFPKNVGVFLIFSISMILPLYLSINISFKTKHKIVQRLFVYLVLFVLGMYLGTFIHNEINCL